MENMAPLRSSASHGGSRDLLVRTCSNDSPHSAVNEQIQLARWSKACGNGAKRANARWKKTLAEFEAPPIDAGIDEALQDFMARRKGAVQDMWY